MACRSSVLTAITVLVRILKLTSLIVDKEKN